MRARVLLLNGVPAEIVESGLPERLRPPRGLVLAAHRADQRPSSSSCSTAASAPGRGGLWHPDGRTWPSLRPESTRVATARELSIVRRSREGAPDPPCARLDRQQPVLQWEMLQARFDSPPPPPGGEWVSAFASYSTDFPEGAAPLPARLAVDFPGRHQSRTVVQGIVTVAPEDAGQAQVGGSTARTTSCSPARSSRTASCSTASATSSTCRVDQATGEPAPGLPALSPPGRVHPDRQAGGRQLRPDLPRGAGDHRAVARATDGRRARPSGRSRRRARLLAEANAAIGRREVTLKLLPPPGSATCRPA